MKKIIYITFISLLFCFDIFATQYHLGIKAFVSPKHSENFDFNTPGYSLGIIIPTNISKKVIIHYKTTVSIYSANIPSFVGRRTAWGYKKRYSGNVRSIEFGALLDIKNFKYHTCYITPKFGIGVIYDSYYKTWEEGVGGYSDIYSEISLDIKRTYNSVQLGINIQYLYIFDDTYYNYITYPRHRTGISFFISI